MTAAVMGTQWPCHSYLRLLEMSCLSENRVYVVVRAVTGLVKAVLDCYAVTCSCFS